MPFMNRPILAIKLAILLAICVASFMYIESHETHSNTTDTLLALIGATLVGVGVDTLIDEGEHYTSKCKDE